MTSLTRLWSNISAKHNVLIGDRTAEELKMSIGCVFPAGGGHHGDQGPLPDDRPAPVFRLLQR